MASALPSNPSRVAQSVSTGNVDASKATQSKGRGNFLSFLPSIIRGGHAFDQPSQAEGDGVPRAKQNQLKALNNTDKAARLPDASKAGKPRTSTHVQNKTADPQHQKVTETATSRLGMKLAMSHELEEDVASRLQGHLDSAKQERNKIMAEQQNRNDMRNGKDVTSEIKSLRQKIPALIKQMKADANEEARGLVEYQTSHSLQAKLASFELIELELQVSAITAWNIMKTQHLLFLLCLIRPSRGKSACGNLGCKEEFAVSAGS